MEVRAINDNEQIRYKKIIEKLLRKYWLCKQSVECGEKGMVFLFPSLTPIYETEKVGGGEINQSTTEKYAILRDRQYRLIEQKKKFIDQVERALSLLDYSEQKVIQATYFQEFKPPAFTIYRELGLSKSSYYRVRDSAFEKLAESLNIV